MQVWLEGVYVVSVGVDDVVLGRYGLYDGVYGFGLEEWFAAVESDDGVGVFCDEFFEVGEGVLDGFGHSFDFSAAVSAGLVAVGGDNDDVEHRRGIGLVYFKVVLVGGW